jgi:hypothetical protein
MPLGVNMPSTILGACGDHEEADVPNTDRQHVARDVGHRGQ